MSESAHEVMAKSVAPVVPQPPPLSLDGAQALLADALELVGDDLEAAEERLGELLHSSIGKIPEVGGHLAFAGGKRFRPMLTLLCAQAAGYDDGARITIAAVGELLHTATLLHDDVIDQGDFRRGRPAARLAFGNGLAVLTGDYCLARALQAVARLGDLNAVATMADVVTRMAEGEVAQLDACGDAVLDHQRYSMVIARKTGALIAWCTSVAGLPAPATVEPLLRYGHELGFAFQIADDVLDYTSGPSLGHEGTGKEPGQDLRDGKMTLPLLFACEADPTLHRRVQAALAGGGPMDRDEAADIFAVVQASEGPQRASTNAHRHAQSAREALELLPPSPARSALESVAHYVVRRSW